MDGPAMAVLAPVWLVLGLATFVAAIRAHRSARALTIGRWVLAALFVLAGAGANVLFLLTGSDYTGFADLSYLAFVQDTWRSVVAPNQGLFIGLLIAFEAIAGVLVASGGRRAQVGMVAILAFHVALLSFGWGFFAWSIPMLIAVSLLLRAQRAQDREAVPAPREPVLTA